MTDPSKSLVDEIARIAISLTANHIAILADRLTAVRAPTAPARAAVMQAVPTPLFKSAVQQLWETWQLVPDIDGLHIAGMLRAASATSGHLRSSQSIELAWTGPTSNHVPVRLSNQALLDLINEARSHLVIFSYAAYKVPAVTAALRAAAVRGVDVRLVLESAEDSGGKLSHDAAEAFEELNDLVSFWVWPKARRPEGGASMHVKAVVADRRIALVTSANLTGAALAKNMELGVVVRGGGVPQRLADHVTALMASGQLVEVGPA